MFVRSKVVKGHTYYQLVEGYRDGAGKVRHRTVMSLGRSPTVRDALDEALCQLSRVKEAGGDVVKAEADLSPCTDDEMKVLAAWGRSALTAPRRSAAWAATRSSSSRLRRGAAMVSVGSRGAGWSGWTD